MKTGFTRRGIFLFLILYSAVAFWSGCFGLSAGMIFYLQGDFFSLLVLASGFCAIAGALAVCWITEHAQRKMSHLEAASRNEVQPETENKENER